MSGIRSTLKSLNPATRRLTSCATRTNQRFQARAAAPGTGLGSSDASLIFRAADAGLYYVKITASGGKRVLVSDLFDDFFESTVAVGDSATGTILSPTDTGEVHVPLVEGTTYQIDVRSDGHPSIDPWIIDIWDESGPITRTGWCDYTNTPPGPPVCTTFFGASYDGFFDHDSGPGNAARVIYTATKTEQHSIVVGSRGAPSQRLGGWHVTVTEAPPAPALRRVLRRLRGGHFHHRHRECGGHRGCGRGEAGGRLCVGRD